MKKSICLISFLAIIVIVPVKAQLFSTATAYVGFFSKTPVENVDARSNTALAVINTEKRELAINVANKSFRFENKLMEEHFNEKYMESDKYPNSTFKGRINENVDLSKDGIYNVTVTGKLQVHGVEKERTISGVVEIGGGKVTLKSEFKIPVRDHNVEIPKLIMAKIAEEMSVSVEAVLAPRNK